MKIRLKNALFRLKTACFLQKMAKNRIKTAHFLGIKMLVSELELPFFGIKITPFAPAQFSARYLIRKIASWIQSPRRSPAVEDPEHFHMKWKSENTVQLYQISDNPVLRVDCRFVRLLTNRSACFGLYFFRLLCNQFFALYRKFRTGKRIKISGH